MSEFSEFGKVIVSNAGKILLNCGEENHVIIQKDIQDFATNADLTSEKYIIEAILNKYPNHGIESEETGTKNEKSEYKWIIDPLDGTKDYIRNIPQWNCSIALQKNEETLMSVVNRPCENTLYSASKNEGAFRNGKNIEVSKITKLDEAIVYCYLPSSKRNLDKFDWAWDKLKEIEKRVYRLRSLSDENTGLCWLAQGGCEAFLNLSNPPKIHDILPGLFISKEAGAFNAVNQIPLIVANNEKIYNELVSIINN